MKRNGRNYTREENQGRVDEIPTLHMGPAAVNMERRANREFSEGKCVVKRSDIGNINRQIKVHNRLVMELKLKFEAMINYAKDFISVVASKLESIRARIIGNNYIKSVLENGLKSIQSNLTCEQERITRYNSEIEKIVKAGNSDVKELCELQNRYQTTSNLQVFRKRNIKERIRELQDKIEMRSDYKQKIALLCGYRSDAEYHEACSIVESMSTESKDLEQRIHRVKCDADELIGEYNSVLASVAPDDMPMLNLRRSEIRADFDSETIEALKKAYKDDYCDEIVTNILDKTDNDLKMLDKRKKPKESSIKWDIRT